MDTTTETAPIAREAGPDPVVGSTSHIHPLDGLDDEPRVEDPTTATGSVPVVPAAPTKRTRSVGSNRHVTSLVLALVAVPAGYGFVDYAAYRAAGQTGLGQDRVSDRLMIMLGAAAACFLLATLAGRISAMGPLVAGLVWGAAPAAWVMLDYSSYVDRLNDLPEFWTHTGFGLASVGFALFPAVAGLLLGVAVAGRWRRPVPVSRW